MKCPQCGMEFEGSRTRCPQCGAELRGKATKKRYPIKGGKPLFWVLAAGALVLIAVACMRQQIVLLNRQAQADATYAEALALYDAEDYNGTIEILETEIDSGIDSVEIYYLLGQAYEMAGDMEAALSTYAEGAYKYASKSEAEILTEARVTFYSATFYSAQMQAAYETCEFGAAIEYSNQIPSLDQDNQEA